MAELKCWSTMVTLTPQNLFGFAWTIQGSLSFKKYRTSWQNLWKIKDFCNSLWNLLEALKWKMKSFHSKVCKDSLLKTIRTKSLFGCFSRHDCKTTWITCGILWKLYMFIRTPFFEDYRRLRRLCVSLLHNWLLRHLQREEGF